MSLGVFTQKDSAPKEEEIEASVGPTLKLWNKLGQWVRENLSAQEELKYMYGKKYGWARRFQIRGALLTALYPTQNGFTVQVILNRTALEQAGRLKLGKSAKQAIDRADLYAEGKWLFIPIESERDAEDTRRLLELKIACGHKQSTRKLQTSGSKR